MRNKTNTRLTEEQKKYLVDKYDKGETEKMKFNAVDVANEMEVLMKDNEYVFEPHQWLKATQIQCFWSRLTRVRRQASQNKHSQQTRQDDDDDESEYEDELFEQTAQEAKIGLFKRKNEQEHKAEQSSSSPGFDSPSSLRKTKVNQRSSEDLPHEQPPKRSSADKPRRFK